MVSVHTYVRNSIVTIVSGFGNKSGNNPFYVRNSILTIVSGFGQKRKQSYLRTYTK